MRIVVLMVAGGLLVSGPGQDKQPPQVKIPEPGVPQIMTLEGSFVRAA